MPWIALGQFDLVDKWQFTRSLEGEIFRIKHKLTGDDYSSVRGVIAQGFEDTQINVFNPKLFTYKEEREIFAFYFPIGLNQHSLCFKRLDTAKSKWVINVEVFQSENDQDNLNNYLITRFGENILNMALYPRLYSGSLAVKSAEIKLVTNQAKKVRDKNLSRTAIKIITSGHPVVLTTGFDVDGKPIALLDKVPPNYNYEKEASSAGIYQGEIWAISGEETYIDVIEYSAK